MLCNVNGVVFDGTIRLHLIATADKNREEVRLMNILDTLCQLLVAPGESVRNTATCLAATLV